MKNGSDRIMVFDTTLRDGEQAAGTRLNPQQKLEIARQLRRLHVDVIEAGFPASSPGDLEAVKLISREVRGPVITGLARAVEKDIALLWEAVKEAERNRIHIVLGSSDKHISGKFSSSRQDVLERGVAAVKFAKKFTEDVEYSTEDASRSDFDYLCRVIDAVIKAGATVVNIPDTVGWAVPEEFGALIRKIRERVPATDRAVLSVHCHNDLGFATSNTMAAIQNGAAQVEVTVNGIGERAGNASLEETAMLLRTRKDVYRKEVNIDFSEIIRTSRLVSDLMELPVQANKAVVGRNAFSHSSGIHQDGILKQSDTYEIISPRVLGLTDHQIVLTARSGKHAVKHTLARQGIALDTEALQRFYPVFLDLAETRKSVSPESLVALYHSAFA